MYIELEKFISACIEKGKCEELGNSKMGNRQYNIIKSSYLALKKLGQLDDMVGLLEHENPYVRLWAASYMLPIAPIKSEGALKELSTLMECRIIKLQLNKVDRTFIQQTIIIM